MPKITAIRDYQSLKIYMNKMLYVEIRMDNHDGVQSWLEGSNKAMFFIEFYRKAGGPIILEFDQFNTWKAVLKLIDENI